MRAATRADDAALFASAISGAVAAACTEWGYPSVPPTYFSTFDKRVPDHLQARIGAGIRQGLISVDRYLFRAVGQPASKGPYKLVGRNQATRMPQPHWEYYVQLAEFVRLVRAVGSKALTVGLEDGLMDVTVRRKGELLWCVEVKEKAAKLIELQADLERYGPDVPVTAPDRGNDGLRKAKYLVRHRPPFLSLLALDARHDYAVRYRGETSFTLEPMESAAAIEARLS